MGHETLRNPRRIRRSRARNRLCPRVSGQDPIKIGERGGTSFQGPSAVAVCYAGPQRSSFHEIPKEPRPDVAALHARSLGPFDPSSLLLWWPPQEVSFDRSLLSPKRKVRTNAKLRSTLVRRFFPVIPIDTKVNIS